MYNYGRRTARWACWVSDDSAAAAGVVLDLLRRITNAFDDNNNDFGCPIKACVYIIYKRFPSITWYRRSGVIRIWLYIIIIIRYYSEFATFRNPSFWLTQNLYIYIYNKLHGDGICQISILRRHVGTQYHYLILLLYALFSANTERVPDANEIENCTNCNVGFCTVYQ